jgi:putative ABC transport system permease protein
MMSMTTELRHAIRGLMRRPVAALTAIVTLALALSATAALLIVLHALYVAPLPYANAARLQDVQAQMPLIGLDEAGMSWPLAQHVESLPVVEQVAGWQATRAGVLTAEHPEVVNATSAEASLFEVLGGRAIAIGRAFTDAEAQAGEALVVLSHEFARERFGSGEAAIGGDLTVDGVPHRIVGVLAPGASFPDADRRFIRPLPRRVTDDMSRGVGEIRTVVLLRPGADAQALGTQLAGLGDRLEASSEDFRGMREITGLALKSASLRERRTGELGDTFAVLALALGGLLLLAGANVSSVLMERFAARRAELAVRSALGASRRRLVRLVLVDATILSVSGWLLGLLLTSVLLSLQQRWSLLELPSGLNPSFAVAPVLASLAVTMLLSLLTAAFPALMAARVEAGGARLSQRGGSDGRARAARRSLVVAQTALSLSLLIVAMLLARSLSTIWQVDPGFSRDGVLTVDIDLRGPAYAEPQARLDLANRLIDRAAALPGVRHAGISSMLPFGSNYSLGNYEVEGVETAGQPPIALASGVSTDYFQAMSIPLLRGRAFTLDENATAQGDIAIVDRAFAERHFGDADPVGRRMRFVEGEWLTIVGVVGTVRQNNLAEAESHGQVYLPMADLPPDSVHLVLDTRLSVSALMPAVQALVRDIDASLPVRRMIDMEQRLDESLADRTGPLGIVGFFAAVALLLAGIGLYGVLATAVIERRPEIGVRLALGARRGAVVRGIFGEGLRMIVAGALVGVCAAALCVPLLRNQLYGVGAGDLTSYAVAIGALLAIAIVATAFPAWRASRVDPSQALRNE